MAGGFRKKTDGTIVPMLIGTTAGQQIG